MMMKKRILFIDDDEMVLQSLKRSLYAMTQEWEMEFVNSGAKALAVMAEKPIDIIISDMIMPGMDGAELLNIVRTLYPATARFILSGNAPGEDVFKSIISSEYFIAKPANINQIKSVVRKVSEEEQSLIDLHQSIKAKAREDLVK